MPQVATASQSQSWVLNVAQRDGLFLGAGSCSDVGFAGWGGRYRWGLGPTASTKPQSLQAFADVI